ncbi:MAG: DUF6600 domain-containing protein [Verrucomicrobiota bacterium]
MQSLFLSAWLFMGAIAPFTERGNADFDTILDLLNPYGAWVESVPGQTYVYKPFCAPDWIPMTEGHWVYSDYGWFWIGNEPHQWVTTHYGYWKRDESGFWTWFPSGEWHTNPVDWRGTKTHIGWRPSPLNKLGDFVESEEKRVAHPEEWVFVKREDFGKPMTRATAVTGTAAKEILNDSYALSHEIQLYRVIARAGPDPIGYPDAQPVERRNVSKPMEKSKDKDKPKAEEKIAYYTTMSLPTYWTPIPLDAKSDQIYIYRPKFYQDNDGIQRRIKIWNNPKARLEAIAKVNQALGVAQETSTTNATEVVAPIEVPKAKAVNSPQEVKEEVPKK